MFECPKCRHTELIEHTYYPVLSKTIIGFNRRYNHFLYSTTCLGPTPPKKWMCASCRWEIPVSSEKALKEWLGLDNPPE